MNVSISHAIRIENNRQHLLYHHQPLFILSLKCEYKNMQIKHRAGTDNLNWTQSHKRGGKLILSSLCGNTSVAIIIIDMMVCRTEMHSQCSKIDSSSYRYAHFLRIRYGCVFFCVCFICARVFLEFFAFSLPQKKTLLSPMESRNNNYSSNSATSQVYPESDVLCILIRMDYIFSPNNHKIVARRGVLIPCGILRNLFVSCCEITSFCLLWPYFLLFSHDASGEYIKYRPYSLTVQT